MRSLELKLNIAAGCLCFYKRKVILRLINTFRKSICIIFSFKTQNLPENHFGELEPPVKILVIITNNNNDDDADADYDDNYYHHNQHQHHHHHHHYYYYYLLLIF